MGGGATSFAKQNRFTFNIQTAELAKWTCPSLNIDVTIVTFQGYQYKIVKLNSQLCPEQPHEYAGWSDSIRTTSPYINQQTKGVLVHVPVKTF